MPHYICRWASGDVLVASVNCREELDAILEQKGEAGCCRVARYGGPLAFELAPRLPGIARSSSKRFKVGISTSSYCFNMATELMSQQLMPIWAQFEVQRPTCLR
jgi:hypothetical protein